MEVRLRLESSSTWTDTFFCWLYNEEDFLSKQTAILFLVHGELFVILRLLPNESPDATTSSQFLTMSLPLASRPDCLISISLLAANTARDNNQRWFSVLVLQTWLKEYMCWWWWWSYCGWWKWSWNCWSCYSDFYSDWCRALLLLDSKICPCSRISKNTTFNILNNNM